MVLTLGLGMVLLLGIEVTQVVIGFGKVGRDLKCLLIGRRRLLKIVFCQVNIAQIVIGLGVSRR